MSLLAEWARMGSQAVWAEKGDEGEKDGEDTGKGAGMLYAGTQRHCGCEAE
jgi:hypothetical protein